MRWKNLAGPIIGMHCFGTEAVHSPDIVDLLARAQAAGVHWSPVWRDHRADFCLMSGSPDRWNVAALSMDGIHAVQLGPFKDLLYLHETTRKPLRDLLLAHVFRHEHGRYRKATYRVTIQRSTAIHEESPREHLCFIEGASTSYSGNWFFQGKWSDTNESDMPAEFPASVVRGAMEHVTSGVAYLPVPLAKMIFDDANSEGDGIPGNTVSIGGDVGQSIAGDTSFSAPVTFSVGKKRSKPD